MARTRRILANVWRLVVPIFCPLYPMLATAGELDAPMPDPTGAGPLRVYVGTYTGGASRGLYRLELDPSAGTLSEPELAAETVNPSYLAIGPDGRSLFAVNEVGQFEGHAGGGVSAFRIDPATGALTALNAQSSRGADPCYITVDGAGRHVLVANYSGGSVAVLPIEAGGRLGEATAFVAHRGSGPDPKRQEGPHAHSINLDPAGRFAIAADLGLDRLLVYRYDEAQGTLTPNDPPSAAVAPGAGPRHLAFGADGRYAYAINELDSTITAFAYDPDRGTLTAFQTVSTLPEGFAGPNTTADIHVHPSGRFLYGSNRGHDSLAIFAIDPASGRLTPVGHTPTGGRTPRNFAIDPSGRILLAANQGSDSIVAFRIDPDTGTLTPTGATATVGKPVCLRFAANGR